MLKINHRFFREKIDNFPKPKEYQVIEKETVLKTDIPIHLEGELSRVKQVPFGISLEQELNEFNSETYTAGPFYQYQLENLLVLKNRIYFDNYEYNLNPLKKAPRLYNSREINEYSSASFTSMRISTVFFGHWLREELILIDYLQGMNKNIISSSPLTAQKEEISEFFNLQFTVSTYAKIHTAEMFHGWQHTEIYKNLLKEMKEKISLLNHQNQVLKNPRTKIIYLKRGLSSTKRSLTNEDEMLERLSQSYNIESYIAESTPIEKLYSAIYSADIILSIEGSQMAHGIIAGRPGAVMACIQPPMRFYNPFKNYCTDSDIKYAIYVAEIGHNDSFYVDIERFRKFIYVVEGHIH